MDLGDDIRATTAGVILAGGESRRMGGRDKALMMLAGRPLLEHVLERLRLQVACVAINANGDAARFEPFGVPVFGDGEEPSEGPASGIRAALDWVGGQTSFKWLVTAPTDAPFVPLDLVERLVGEAHKARALVALAATGRDKHPTIAAWSLIVRDKFADLMEREGLRAVHVIGEALGAIVVQFEAPASGPDPFFNINSPSDLRSAEAWAGRVQRTDRRR